MRALLLQVQDRFNTDYNRWMIAYLCKWILLILGIILYTLVITRCAYAKAERHFEEWQSRFVDDYNAQMLAKEIGIPPDPRELQLNAESEALAKVLYGVKDNSTDDLKTYCWCALNRVDSADYPDTLEEVIAQPKQWMRYDEENPVLENLYQIAREQLETWHNGTRRPVSSEFVYMNWSPAKITLRDRWEEGSWTNYWRFNN